MHNGAQLIAPKFSLPASLWAFVWLFLLLNDKHRAGMSGIDGVINKLPTYLGNKLITFLWTVWPALYILYCILLWAGVQLGG